MYINPKKQKSNDRFYLVALLVAVAALLVIAVVNAPSFFFSLTGPDGEPLSPSASSSIPPETGAPAPVTDPKPTETAPPATSAPETSAPATSAPPATSVPPDTHPPVTQPPITSSETSAPAPAEPAISWITPGVTETAAPPAVYIRDSECVLQETEDAGQEYQDKIVFLGDSTTYSFLYYGVLTGGKNSTQVWTPSSRTLTLDGALATKILYPETGEEISLKDALKAKKPEIFVITLGVNGIAYMDEKYFKNVYTKLVGIVRDASPETKIILNSIFPVATNWEKTKSINNDKINAANGWILDVAEENGAFFLDSHSVLAVDPGGYMPISYQNGDGLHLNKESCKLVLNYIRTHAIPEK